jgi:GT2 family glycosyltransferase
MVPVLIVPVLNRYDLLARLIHSIDYPVKILHVIDNGGTFQEVWNPNVERTVIWQSPENLGAATSWNFGIIANQSARWWLIAGNDTWFTPGSLETIVIEARTDAVVLAEAQPTWAAFTIGEKVVARVGLFDDNFHPAYFEDNDYSDRCAHHGIEVARGTARVHHDNSSTIHSNPSFFEWNKTVSFPASHAYYLRKKTMHDVSAGRLDLYRRRRTAFPK